MRISVEYLVIGAAVLFLLFALMRPSNNSKALNRWFRLLKADAETIAATQISQHMGAAEAAEMANRFATMAGSFRAPANANPKV